jgi:KUP system potassium uptake protein
MLTTTCLFYFACRKLWQWPLWRAAMTCGLFAAVELTFFASNALKIFHGGWLPLAIGGALFYLMTTWKMGRAVINQQMEKAVPLKEFVAQLDDGTSETQVLTPRSKGTAVFLTSSTRITPGALVQNVKHNRVIHERNIVLTIATDNVPRRNSKTRLEIVPLPMQFFQVIAHYGFMESPTIDEIMACAAGNDLKIEVETTSFFMGGQILVPAKTRGLPAWREAAFLIMSKNAQRASEFLDMPCDRTIEILWEAEI